MACTPTAGNANQDFGGMTRPETAQRMPRSRGWTEEISNMSKFTSFETTKPLTVATPLRADHKGAPDRFAIDRAIDFFYQQEAHCDALIQQQDRLIRSVVMQANSLWGAALGGVATPGKTGLSDNRSNILRAEDLVAEAWAKDLSPLISPDFATVASDQEREEIDELEFKIHRTRQMMDEIEGSILRHKPATPKEMILKLKFMAGLVRDGGEVDIEALARLAEDVSASLLLGFEDFAPRSQH
jgi:hypothetical protein